MEGFVLEPTDPRPHDAPMGELGLHGVELAGPRWCAFRLPATAIEFHFPRGDVKLLSGGLQPFEPLAWVSDIRATAIARAIEGSGFLLTLRVPAETALLVFGEYPATHLPNNGRAGGQAGAWIRATHHQLCEADGIEPSLEIVRRAWAELAMRAPKEVGRISKALVAMRSGAAVRVGRLVEDSGLSHRHFIAEFRRLLGVCPKTFARILRFEVVLERLSRNTPIHWATLALEAGYSDQSHLVNECRRLTGTTPRDLALRYHSPTRTLEPPLSSAGRPLASEAIARNLVSAAHGATS